VSRVTLAPGVVTDARTASMLAEAQELAGFQFLYAQGSYNGTNVAASAGTHARAGVVDIRTVPMRSRSQKLAAVRALRLVGFAAWIRPYVEGVWGEHIHAVAIGCPDLAPSAARQVTAYYQGRDGLRGNRPDPHADLGVKPTSWDEYRKPTPVVSFRQMSDGKHPEQTKRVQAALRRHVDPRLVVDGVWKRADSRAWARAVVKFRRSRVSLLSYLGAGNGFRGAR
jgi:hypothetical protein